MSGSRVDVSVVIVNWNTRDLLLKCLASLDPGLSRCAGETIVVDNHSSDGSAAAVRERHPEVLVIENTSNLGFSRANNIGIRRSRGRYVCLVNSDVVVLPGCIDRLVEYADRHPEAGIVGPRILNTDGTLQTSWWRFPSVLTSLVRTFWLDSLLGKLSGDPRRRTGIRRVDSLSGCFLLVRRATLERIGLLDEDFFFYSEDIDLCRRCHAADWAVIYHGGVHSIHAGGASSSAASARFYVELHKAMLRYWKKHHGDLGGVFFVLNAILHHLVRLLPLGIAALGDASARSLARRKLLRSVSVIAWALAPARRWA